MATKKLIAFSDEQLELIEKFSDKYKKTFTEAVRVLIDNALKDAFGEDIATITDDSIAKKLAELEGEVKKLSWWTCDDNTSRLGNMEIELEKMQKQINILTAASKLFKGHVKDRSIHLQD